MEEITNMQLMAQQKEYAGQLEGRQSTRQQLFAQKQILQIRLQEVDAAIKALDSIPGIDGVLDALAKVKLHY